MPQAKMTDMGNPPPPAVAGVWRREDTVPLWLTLDVAYGSEQHVCEAQS